MEYKKMAHHGRLGMHDSGAHMTLKAFAWKTNISDVPLRGWVAGRGDGRSVGGCMWTEAWWCPVDAICERRLRSRSLWFSWNAEFGIHLVCDASWFKTAVVKLLDIALLWNTMFDLKVDPNVFADEAVGVTLKKEVILPRTQWRDSCFSSSPHVLLDLAEIKLCYVRSHESQPKINIPLYFRSHKSQPKINSPFIADKWQWQANAITINTVSLSIDSTWSLDRSPVLARVRDRV